MFLKLVIDVRIEYCIQIDKTAKNAEENAYLIGDALCTAFVVSLIAKGL